MKKIILPALAASMLAFTSCGGAAAEDFNVDEVKDACGCAEGLKIIAKDILATVGDMSEDEMEKDEAMMKKVESKFEKLDELEDKCRGDLDVGMKAMLECDADLESVMKDFEKKF